MTVQVTNPDTNETWEYYMFPRLRKFLDEKVKIDLKGKDKDYVLFIDGYEGSGKSTLGLQMARYVDPTLNLSRVVMNAEEFRQAVLNSKPNQCIIYDEAVNGMTGSDSLRRVGKMLKSLMMQMRQKNLFIIIIMPYIFEFNKYAVLGRARSFFHVYELKGKRGWFAAYNKKDTRTLYLKGKKTFSYLVKTRFLGRFCGKYAIEEQSYRKKKDESLQDIDEDDENASVKVRNQRNIAIKLLYSLMGTQKAVSEALTKGGFRITDMQISRILGKAMEIT